MDDSDVVDLADEVGLVDDADGVDLADEVRCPSHYGWEFCPRIIRNWR